ncbi:MAG: hypothetical protein LBI96_02065 [Odoribacteraceae bacterium]|jgi:hypothetical protein|nr:hypothetical protein [Odoribacteraceae bacterium]
MKTNIFIALLLGFALHACYEDKGNYTYHDVVQPVIELENSYTVYRFDTLRINPKITTLNGEDEYDYTWTLYNLNAFVAVIGNEKELVYPVLTTSNQFRIYLQLTSRATGITYTKFFPLSVVSRESMAWYVLKTIGGNTELDLFFEDDGEDIPNFLEYTVGYNMEGEARGISYIGEYKDYVDPNDFSSGGQWCSRVFLASEKEVLVYDQLANLVTRNSSNLFYSAPSLLDVHGVFGAANEVYILADGKLYDVSLMISMTGRFGMARQREDNLPFTLSPYAACLPISFTRPLLFDETHRSFLVKNIFVPALFEHDYPTLVNMPYDLKFMGTKIEKSGIQGLAYALMQHRVDQSWQIFGIDIGETEASPTTHAVPSTSGLITAELRAQHARLDYIYFVKNNQLFIYNILAGTEESVYTAPSGEQITMMKCEFDSFTTDANGQYTYPAHLLVIGTNTGDAYTVRVFHTDINTGRPTDEYKKFQGTGKPADLQSGSPDNDMTVNI